MFFQKIKSMKIKKRILLNNSARSRITSTNYLLKLHGSHAQLVPLTIRKLTVLGHAYASIVLGLEHLLFAFLFDVLVQVFG